MGLSINDFMRIAECIPRARRKGRVITLGKQKCQVEIYEMMHLRARFDDLGVNMHYENLQSISDHMPKFFEDVNELQSKNELSIEPQFVNHPYEERHIRTSAAFKLLGYDEVLSIDYSDYEGADYVFDLNEIVSDPEILSSASLIVDGGTLEHIFHVPNVMKNIFYILGDRGVIYHANPMNNYVDHGFYQFSPTFYFDYYIANQFQILGAWGWQHKLPRPLFEPNYSIDLMNRPPYLENKVENFNQLMQFLALKLPQSTANATPQQGTYRKAWREQKTAHG